MQRLKFVRLEEEGHRQCHKAEMVQEPLMVNGSEPQRVGAELPHCNVRGNSKEI